MGSIDNSTVVVTGGASFIGSHLVDSLCDRNCKVIVIDDLSSGKVDNIKERIESGRATLARIDLENCGKDTLVQIFRGAKTVFHLAAIHGGRGYIDTHPASVASNAAIDHHVFEAALDAEVDNVVFASSACVYPPILQSFYGSDYKLKENDSDIGDLTRPLSADVEYGWAKLFGEIQLQAFHKQYGLNGCSLRFVTVYGPRENESHAIIALIKKAHERMDPYVIWGTGEQDRDFTYVSDIVSGCVAAAEKVKGYETVNLGTGRRIKIKDVANEIFEVMDWAPERVSFDTTKPEGVQSRCLDISKASSLLGWKPSVSLEVGLERTVDHYVKTNTRAGMVTEAQLFERT